MKDQYIYPAVFSFADDGISIEFPDLPGCYPCADTLEEAVKNAKEALGLHLYGMEEDGEKIPEPSDVRTLSQERDTICMLVEVYMPPLRDKIRNRYVKKTLSIPYWLNAEAERNGVNFSGVLQEALKNYLGIRQ